MSQTKFIIKSIGIGMLLYIITGFLLAVIINVGSEPAHPHSMTGLLYFFLPVIGAITGIVLGFFLSLREETQSIKLIKKKLLKSVPYSLALLVLFVFLMGRR